MIATEAMVSGTGLRMAYALPLAGGKTSQAARGITVTRAGVTAMKSPSD